MPDTHHLGFAACDEHLAQAIRTVVDVDYEQVAIKVRDVTGDDHHWCIDAHAPARWYVTVLDKDAREGTGCAPDD